MFCFCGKIATNGLALGAVADFGVQNFHLTTNVDSRYNVQLTTSPAIEPNDCWWLCLIVLCNKLFQTLWSICIAS